MTTSSDRDATQPRVDSPASAAAGGAGSLYAILGTHDLAAATDLVMADAETMRFWLARYAACPQDKLQGRAFEYLETLKFNDAAGRAGSDLRASTTQMRTPTGPVDIEILKGADQEVVREVQAKSYGDPGMTIRALAKEKYRGQGRLVPSSQEAAIRAALDGRSPEHLDTSGQSDIGDNLMGRLEHEDVASGGTSRQEADFTAKHPELAALRLEGAAALREVGTATAQGAAVGGGLGLVFNGLANAVFVAHDRKTHTEAIVDTLAGTVSAASRGGAVAGGAKLIAITARRNGLTNSAAGAGPTAIANTVFEVGHSTYRYVGGDIDTAAFREEAGGAALRGAAAFYCGLAGQILIPVPVAGALAGSVVGYVTAAVLVQSGLLGIGPRNVVAQERARREEIEHSCRQAVLRMSEYRSAIEEIAADGSRAFQAELVPRLDRFEAALFGSDAGAAFEAVAEINLALGRALPFRDIAEFDAFMSDPDSKLVL